MSDTLEPDTPEFTMPLILRRILRLGGRALPYVEWLVPVLERVLGGSAEGIPLALHELQMRLDTLQTTQREVAPAFTEQQRRLDRLEDRSVALSESIEELSSKQAELADQMRTLLAWTRGAAIAGISLLLILTILGIFFLRHIPARR